MSPRCLPCPVPRRGRVLALVVAGAATVASAAQPTVEYALGLKPAQSGVDCDRPSAAEAKSATIAMEKEGGVNAWVVRGAGGEVLRAFADTNGNRVVDRWSYYKDGVEVYRDIDSDHDTKVDQSRWLNGAGGRWGIDEDANGSIDTWKVLSAEEATAEIIAVLRSRDAAAFARLLPTKADLEAAGFEGERLTELLQRIAAAPKAFATLAAAQKSVAADARWTSMLTPQAPGTIPAGTAGLTKDVSAYDNVVALFDGASGSGQVYVGSLLRCGDVWRPIDAPQLAGAQGEIAEVGGFFTPRIGGTGMVGGAEQDETLKPLVARLQEIEAKMTSADGKTRAGLAAQQVATLDQVLAAAAAAEKGFWTRQLVETLAAYVQEGLVSDGLERLETLAASAGDDEPLAAFIAFRLAQARYSASMQQPDADGEKLQNAWFGELTAFVEKYPSAPESAEAMLQLAFRDEFEGREAEAIARYRQVADTFGDTPQARKSAGAVRRLESVGKPLDLAGPLLDGKPLAIAGLKGTPVLVHYWSTDCEPCKVDLAQIRELATKYGRKVAIVGVALDADKARLAKFLQAKPLPWPQLYEPGGLDSRLAEDLGVLALPTMILVDAAGNVADRNVSITDLERKIDDLVAGK